MALIENNAYFDLSGSFLEEPSDIVKVNGGSNNTSRIVGISPQPNDYTCEITITNEFGKNVGWLSTVLSDTVEYNSDTWNSWYYDIQESVLAQVTRLYAQELYFAFRWKVSDTEYVGSVASIYEFDTVDYISNIDTEIKALYGAGNDGEWVLVTDITGSFRSFESDGTDWTDLGYAKDIFVIKQTTEPVTIPVTGTIVANETTLSNAEMTIITAWLTALGASIQIIQEALETFSEDGAFKPTDDTVYSTDYRLAQHLQGYLDKATYDTNGDGIVESADKLNDGTNLFSSDGTNWESDNLPIKSPKIITDEIDYNYGNTGGQNSWNNTEDCIDTIINSNVTLQNGRELLKLGRNTSGATITNGSVIAIIGSVGNVAEIELVDIDDLNQSFKVIGVATEDIANNTTGNVTLIGRVRGLDTSAYAEGTILYAGENGTLTDTCPLPPNRCILMAVVETSSAGSGIIWTWPRPLATLDELSDTYAPSVADKDFYVYNATNSRYELENLDDYTFVKTGWPVDMTDKVTNSLVGTTLTTTFSEDVEYYIQNTKYTITAGSYDVTISAGNNFVYLTGDSSTLTASSTVWDIRAGDKALMWEFYYNGTDANSVNCAYEFHSYEMSPVDHYHGHFTDATTVINGLAVSQTSGAETVDVTAGKLMDEDIVIQILNGTLGTAKFTQPLAPLQAYKFYRTGTSELHKVDFGSNIAYNVSSVPQINPYNGSTYSLQDIQNNRYAAYWVVYSTDVNAPVQLWLGQAESDTLNDAIEANGLSSMNFGSIPIAEIRPAYRIMIQRSGSSYTVEQIDNFLIDPQTGIPSNPATSHGSLSGLDDDDHTQYFNQTRLDTEFTDVVVKKDLSSDTEYMPQTASGIADDDLANMYLDDNGVSKKMTLTEIYAGANTATGSFVASADYKADGLGTNKTAFVTQHTFTLNADADVYVDIKAPLSGQIIYGKMPTIASTNTLRISTDNNVTYITAKKDGKDIEGTVLSAKDVAFKYDGTNWLFYDGEIEILSGEQTYNLSIQSEQSIVAVEGSPLFNGNAKLYGDSAVQLVANGNFTDGTTGWTSLSFASSSVVDNIIKFTVSANDGRLQQQLSLNIGDVVYRVARVKSTSSLVGIGDTSSILDAHSGSGEFEILSSIRTETIANRYVSVVDTRTSGFDEIEVDWIMAIPIPDVWSSLTATELANKYSTYFSGLKSVDNPVVTTVNKNKFDGELRNGSYSTSDGSFSVTNDNFGNSNIVSVQPSTSYVFSDNLGTWNYRVFYYDANEEFIGFDVGTTSSSAFTTPSNARYINFRIYLASSGSLIPTIDIQLELGTTATDYVAHEVSSVTYNQTLRAVNDVRDYIDTIDNNLHTLVGYDFNDVVKYATGWVVDQAQTNTIRVGLDLSSLLGYKLPADSSIVPNISLKIGDKTYYARQNSGSSTEDSNFVTLVETGLFRFRPDIADLPSNNDAGVQAYLQANDVTFQFELAEEVITEQIDYDGIARAFDTMTIELTQDNGFSYPLVTELAMDNRATLQSLVKLVSENANEITKLEDTKLDNTDEVTVKALYESNTDTNAYTDAEQTKLSGIEDGATADQTDSQIKTAYENNADTNAYTDSEKTKLSGIETGATADQSDAEIKTAYENNSNTNAYTDADETKVGHISVTQAVDLDTMESDINNIKGTEVYVNGSGLAVQTTTDQASATDRSFSTTIPTGTTHLEIHYGQASGNIRQITMPIEGRGTNITQGLTWQQYTSSGKSIYYGLFFYDDSSTFQLYAGAQDINGTHATSTTLKIYKIIAREF